MNAQIDFQTRQATAWIIVAIALILIGWDIYAAFFTKGAGDTISEVTLGWARKRPVVPFIVGVICGHCFWFQVERIAK